MNRFLASSCMTILAFASGGASAQEAELPREVVDAFITGGSIVASGESSSGDCQPASDEEVARTGQETICGERNTVVFLGGQTTRNAPTSAAPRPAAAPRRPATPAAALRPRSVAIPERCAPSQSEALNMCLTFRLGSSQLTERARSQIRVFAESMLANQSTERFLIAGHTDVTGTEIRNCALSLARAESVVAYMVGLGVSASQLQPVGYGQLALQDGVPATDPRNRRVEIVRGSAEAGAGESCTAV
jgi:outer membrane protein OmpA-like peptidoglycan-associated protein